MSQMKRRPSFRHDTAPRGVAVVLILASIVAATMISAATLKLLVRSTEDSRHFHSQAQIDWLIRCGIDRAKAQLRLNARYQGETLDLRTGLSHGPDAARVIVRVSDEEDRVSHRFVHVQVQLGSAPTHRIQGSRTTRVSLSKTE